MIYLEPCPFCGQELEQRHRRYNPYARCATDDCMGGKLPLISLDVPEDIERWNRRGREQALAALCQEAATVLERTANDTLDGRNMAVRLRESPAVSLTRLKAEWQAEALDELMPAICDVADRAEVRNMRDELRRQAKEKLDENGSQ